MIGGPLAVENHAADSSTITQTIGRGSLNKPPEEYHSMTLNHDEGNRGSLQANPQANRTSPMREETFSREEVFFEIVNSQEAFKIDRSKSPTLLVTVRNMGPKEWRSGMHFVFTVEKQDVKEKDYALDKEVGVKEEVVLKFDMQQYSPVSNSKAYLKFVQWKDLEAKIIYWSVKKMLILQIV